MEEVPPDQNSDAELILEPWSPPSSVAQSPNPEREDEEELGALVLEVTPPKSPALSPNPELPEEVDEPVDE